MAERTKPHLIQAGGLSIEELKNAIVKYSTENKSLVESVLADERVSEEGLADCLAAYARFPRVNLATTTIDPEAVKLLPQDLARRHLCIPLRVEGRTLLLAMANPTDYKALQEIEFTVGRNLKVLVCTRTEVQDAIQKHYEAEDTLRAFTENLEDAQNFEIVADVDAKDADVNLTESRSQAELAPVVKVVNLMIQDAIKQRATDIHVEPTLNDVQVRVRVDGVLRPLMQLPKWLTNPVSSRMKVLARLDIAERRLPQDGRIKVQRENKSYDLRVSTLPTLFGEKVVLRILSSGMELPTLEQINLEANDLKILMRSLNQPQGMILVTGPTGSGKSTTLYASLGYRKTPDVNIITVEDPVEYQVAGLNQVQVNVKAGLTFAAALRAILRQDPNIVLIGEMRDLETTEIAFHAAMTGHLVLSTLHTNSAIATVSRLLDLGVDPVLISSSISLIIAQRLVRKLCPQCKQPFDPPDGMLERFGVSKDDTVYYQAVGCSNCGGSGYLGRMAVHEMLPMTKTLRELIARKAPEVEVLQAMRQQGMRFLVDRSLEKVREGTTTINEIFRVMQLEEQEKVAFGQSCPNCKATIEPEFAICPNCLTSLKVVCPECRQQLKMDWKICPYCKTPISAEAPAPLPMLPGQVGPSAETATVSSGAAARETSPPPAPPPGRPEPPVTLISHAPAAEAAGADQESLLKTPKILVVDDDFSIRTIVVKSLEQLPFPIETQVASNGIEGMDLAKQTHPDLILLDIMMPGMDGFEVCQKLRSQVETAFIPVIMLTANPSEEGRLRGYLVGTDDYVAKPFNVAELNARVTRLLRRAYGIA
ncbi:MAG: Flp pilus assembly complex ATPase component TadA [Acidobacteria bacterium]|nr:Flp pilus assembly complex ATPase component TadA [Acidobacteriota bacterium]